MSRLRIVIMGYIVRGPVGGLAWHHLQYVMGLNHLGHDVYFVEDSDDYPSCYDPARGITDANPTYGLRFATQTFCRVGLEDRWAYYDAHSSRWLGPRNANILDICTSADVLINLSGMNPLRSWLIKTPVRVFVDTDPVFTQIRHLTDSRARERARQHTAFFSFAHADDRGKPSIPQDGFPWQATQQPVVLDAWPPTTGREQGKFTTVMLWDSYPVREYDGRRYGMKSESFGPYMDLPGRAGRLFELAIGGPSVPRHLLRSKGWALRDPLETTGDPWAYQSFIQDSKGEFSIAKHGYVISNCGWFSERSACYLASGRPVLTQETGFSNWLPTGSGLIPFRTPEEALAGIEQINRSYTFHCRAARGIAEEFFDARRVLADLLERSVRCATKDKETTAGQVLQSSGE